MNALKPMPGRDDPGKNGAVPIDRDTALPGEIHGRKRRSGARWFVWLTFLLLAGGLALGGWRHWRLAEEVATTAAQRLRLVPAVRVAVVKSSGDTLSISLPGNTEAFEAASIYSNPSR